jgi:hypothetical protein
VDEYCQRRLNFRVPGCDQVNNDTPEPETQVTEPVPQDIEVVVPNDLVDPMTYYYEEPAPQDYVDPMTYYYEEPTNYDYVDPMNYYYEPTYD